MISLDALVAKIIAEQELVIGPIAWEVAHRVPGLSFSHEDHQVTVKNQDPKVLEDVVKAYEALFGPASREVCRQAIVSVRAEVDEALLPPALK